MIFMPAPSNLGSELRGDVKSRAGWGIALGIPTVVLGLLLVAYSLFTATAAVMFIGWIMIIAGVFELVQALRAHTVGAVFSSYCSALCTSLGESCSS
jgi:uncharacterized membrane protein HdeD (DUF308 family)